MRKIIQLLTHGGNLLVLLDDGTIWVRQTDSGGASSLPSIKWVEIPGPASTIGPVRGKEEKGG